ncbi:hypothetical protein E4U41_007127 [Claviceps citrina]|nr:hypothetical protein E4U41_007127 [Claviceps citrina]
MHALLLPLANDKSDKTLFPCRPCASMHPARPSNPLNEDCVCGVGTGVDGGAAWLDGGRSHAPIDGPTGTPHRPQPLRRHDRIPASAAPFHALPAGVDEPSEPAWSLDSLPTQRNTLTRLARHVRKMMKREESSENRRNAQAQARAIPLHSKETTTSQARPGSNSSKPRQKRWAPKVTTGCKTCRARRVKCDEAKPYCKQCITRGRWCEYAAPPPAKTAGTKNGGLVKSSAKHEAQDYTAKRPSDHALPPQYLEVARRLKRESESPARTINPGPKPPSWDVVEGIRYLYQVMAPEHLSNSLGGSDYDNQFVGTPTVIIKHSFLMVVTAHRIKTACRDRNVLPAPDQLVSLDHIWARFYYHMTHSLERVNRLIASPEPAIGVFYRIMDILHVELTLLSPTWRPHIEGCATLIHLYGGVLRVLDLSVGQPSPILAIQLILIIATMTNTTSPAKDQIRGFTDWTTPEICTVYSTTMYSEMPCPTHLFLNIMQINRLRWQAATGASYRHVIYASAREIFANIERFSAENWTEPYSVPKNPAMTLVARIYKTAVTLYGILSLPPPPPPPSSMAAAPMLDGLVPQGHQPPLTVSPLSSYERSRLAFREKLMREVSEAMSTRPIKIYLAWPLAVLGVALCDGSESDRAAVEQYLLKIQMAPQTYCGPTTTLMKLRAFWASGKRRWEDCFNEPCPVLA